VRLLWKKLQLGVIAGLTVLATGCGGLHASYGVSPLSFFLPGLANADSKPANDALNEHNAELAQTENSQINF
jgi:hypothetical protein